ncbi:MAG TPA: hypothetical protein VF771_08405, partial [Longimicrobiaceae bacterium]
RPSRDGVGEWDVISGPWKTRMGAIDDALLHLGAEKGGASDRFEVLGLQRHRHTDHQAGGGGGRVVISESDGNASA